MKYLFLLLFLICSPTVWAQVGLYTYSGTVSGTTTNSGYVGINTNIPQTNLEVVGNGQVIRNTNGAGYTTLRLYNNLNNPFRALEIDYGGSGYSGNLANGGPTGESASITTTGAYPLTFGTSNTARVTIASGGNVGIGIITPTSMLHLVGQGGSWTTSAWNKAIEIPNASVLKWAANSNGLRFGIGQSDAGLYYTRANVDDNSTGPTYDMFISNSGNVGIGSTIPDAKLTVKGQVHAQEVKVDLTVPGPDYVFEKDYQLTSLEDIKTYIDQNKHLPEVPSAKEMEKNGVQLGEMNMLLLKKIEELTLYVIDQNITISKQNERIKTLEDKK